MTAPWMDACDFFETVTLTGARLYVMLAVIEHSTRRVRILGVVPDPGPRRQVPPLRHSGESASPAILRLLPLPPC